MTNRACSAVVLALGLTLIASSPASSQARPLWVLELSVVADEPLDLERPLRVRLYSNAPEKLAGPLPGVQSVASDHLVLDLSPAPVLSRGAPATPEPSFVVDYDSEAVAGLTQSLVEQFGREATDRQLVAFVRGIIEPNYGRGFDIASQVARHRTGDCTEHAVLLAALARSLDLPARVAVGTLIVQDGQNIGAFGHAWTEIHRNGVWSIVDATPLGDDTPMSYVPEGLLENEGPGYMVGFMSSLASGILRVEVLGNVPGAGS